MRKRREAASLAPLDSSQNDNLGCAGNAAEWGLTGVERPVPSSESPFSFGHPRGLFVLTLTEVWERFSFYGMQALLTLYMVDYVLRPGHVEHILGFVALQRLLDGTFGELTVQATASQIFGLYTAFVSFAPLLGSLVGDRLLGQQRTVILGGALMAIGHALMALEAWFLVALVLLISGCGCLKGNISAQLGDLYRLNKSRRSEAFSLFYIGINVGSFLAPLICGLLGEVYGWHYGFGAAAVGMVLGLGIYIKGHKYLPPDTLTRYLLTDAKRPQLQSGDGVVILTLIMVLLLGMFFTVAYSQMANVFPLWVRETTDRSLLGTEIPVTWFQSLDGLFVVAIIPLAILLWRFQRLHGKEPSELDKIAIASVLGVFGMCLLAAASVIANHYGRVNVGWSIGCFALFSLGFVYRWPTTLSLISGIAPPAVNSTMIGMAFFSGFIAHFFVGWLGTLYEKIPHVTFWLIHAAISGVGAVAILSFHRPLNDTLKHLTLRHLN